MGNSSGGGLGAGLLFLPFAIIIAIVVIITLVGYFLALAMCGAIFLGFWVALGIGGNLLVRLVIGFLGDKCDASPEVARLGLAAIFLAPHALLILGSMFALFLKLHDPGNGTSIVMMTIFVLCWVLLLSVPLYYWAFFAKEIPKLHRKMELPFKTEAAIRAEWGIYVVQFKLDLAMIRFRLKLFILDIRQRLKSAFGFQKNSNGVSP